MNALPQTRSERSDYWKTIWFHFAIISTCNSFWKKKKARFLTIFPDLIFIFHTCADFFKNSRIIIMNNYFFHSKAWEDITRWCKDMNFIFEWQNNILWTRKWVKYCFCHKKIKFIVSSSCCDLVIEKIIDSSAQGHTKWSLTDHPLRPLEQTQVHSPG